MARTTELLDKWIASPECRLQVYALVHARERHAPVPCQKQVLCTNWKGGSYQNHSQCNEIQSSSLPGQVNLDVRKLAPRISIFSTHQHIHSANDSLRRQSPIIVPPLTQENGQNRMTEYTLAPRLQDRLNSAYLGNLNQLLDFALKRLRCAQRCLQQLSCGDDTLQRGVIINSRTVLTL